MSSEVNNRFPRPVTETAATTMAADPKGYALSGKIMLSAIIILFLVVVLMASLHLYARWYLLRQRRRQQQLRRRRSRLNGARRPHIVFYVDGNNPNVLFSTGGADDPANLGLEPAVLRSLPVFVYSSKTHPESMECAVCLSEFEEEEEGRVLPKCNHSFHAECIDMWFHSHSTCPICRAAVEPAGEQDNRVNLVVEPGGSSSGLCPGCQHDEEGGGVAVPASSSTGPLGSRRKGLDLTGVRIDVPSRGTGLDDELPLSSPASYGFRSPGARLLSLKRILSMGRKTPTGSSTPGTSCSPSAAAVVTTTELDLESGTPAAESTRVPTPR